MCTAAAVLHTTTLSLVITVVAVENVQMKFTVTRHFQYACDIDFDIHMTNINVETYELFTLQTNNRNFVILLAKQLIRSRCVLLN